MISIWPDVAGFDLFIDEYLDVTTKRRPEQGLQRNLDVFARPACPTLIGSTITKKDVVLVI
jgi:hypothetical protein